MTTNYATNKLAASFAHTGNLTRGENGENKLRSSGSAFVDFFNKVIKGSTQKEIQEGMETMFSQAKHIGEVESIIDMFLMAFHKRQTREGGEGLKDVFYHMFLWLYDKYPETICQVVRAGMLDHYGYWRDVFSIWKMVSEREMVSLCDKYRHYNPLIMAFRDVTLAQRRKDLEALDKFLKSHRKDMRTITVVELEDMISGIIAERKARNAQKLIDADRSGTDQRPELESVMPISVSNVGKFIPKEGRSFHKSTWWYIVTGDDHSGAYARPHLIKQNVVAYLIRGGLKSKNHRTGELVDYPAGKAVPYGAYKAYRHENSLLGAAANVTEQKMCGDRFDKIDFSCVPSLCMKKNSKGFANELRKKSPEDWEEETGNRHPDHPGRVQARRNLRAAFADPTKLNASQQLPHEISFKASIAQSTMDRDLQCALWTSFVAHTNKKLDEARHKMAAEFAASESISGDKMSAKVQQALLSGNVIGCPDMSGSMTWDGKAPHRPYDVAIGLTCLLSEVAAPAWRNIGISFNDQPRVFNLTKAQGVPMNIVEKVHEIESHVGYTTNYQSLHEEIIRHMKNANMKSDEELPVIVVFTDGEFNQQISGDTSLTGHQKIEAMYARAGFRSIPTVVYWNLKPSRNGVQTSSNHPGVQFLQGQAPGLFKYILFGEMCDKTTKEVMVDGNQVTMGTSSVTPEETFRMAMDSEYYYKLLHVLSNSDEKELRDYRFVEPIQD